MLYQSKRYEIRLEATKTVAKYNLETGMESTPKIVDRWSDTHEMQSKPDVSSMLAIFTSFLYPKSGLTVHYLMHLPGQPGRFVAQQTENSRGCYDKKGRFLATYYVDVSYRVVEPMKPFENTMRLPAAVIKSP